MVIPIIISLPTCIEVELGYDGSIEFAAFMLISRRNVKRTGLTFYICMYLNVFNLYSGLQGAKAPDILVWMWSGVYKII